MLWFKKKKTNFADSNLLKGFTDSHSHLLPGVDDGVKTMEDSLKILKRYEELGLKELWCTPHIMEDIPNTTEGLKARFAELKANYDGPIVLHLAAEYMMDSLFEERLASRDLLTHGEDGEYLLVETSYFNPPFGFEEILSNIKSAGYHPILAHPERYAYLRLDDYKSLRNAGITFQMNLGSMAGLYGRSALERAAWIKKNGLYSLAGSDVHSPKMLDAILNAEINLTETIL